MKQKKGQKRLRNICKGKFFWKFCQSKISPNINLGDDLLKIMGKEEVTQTLQGV